MLSQVIDWFIPSDSFANRTDHERASVFVFTHLCGPLLAQPMWIYLTMATGFDASILVLVIATAAFWSLPFLLKFTGKMWLATMLSFQLLTMTVLFAADQYGGFTSPFMPWLVVSLLLGLFYHSRNVVTVLTVFGLNLLLWIYAFDFGHSDNQGHIGKIEVLSALSLASATIYITWMAHYYSRVVELRAELEEEAERCQSVYAELTEARSRSNTAIEIRARFFAKISHELRTPLNAIIGYADLLMEDLHADGSPVDDQRTKDLSRIMAAARHLMSLFSQILDLKSIEERQEHLDVTSCRVGDLCEEVVATSSHLIEKNRNRLIVVCNCGTRELRTDTTKLRQILLNLLSNAAKFTSNGVIKLEFDYIEQSSGDMLRAAVIDTGIGMSEQGLSKIFTDYEQAEEDTTQKYGGTGIGLPLSRRICHLLGGEITATSRPGQGSSFTAWIPAAYCETGKRIPANSAEDTRPHQHRLPAAQGTAA